MGVEVHTGLGAQSAFKVSHPYYKTTFVIRVDGQDPYARYIITTEEGAISKVLSGHYTDPLRAFNNLKNFLSSAKESRAVKKENSIGATSKVGEGSPK